MTLNFSFNRKKKILKQENTISEQLFCINSTAAVLIATMLWIWLSLPSEPIAKSAKISAKRVCHEFCAAVSAETTTGIRTVDAAYCTTVYSRRVGSSTFHAPFILSADNSVDITIAADPFQAARSERFTLTA